MTAGFLLHLSGPRQSYGVSSGFNLRDTHHHPTRSAIIGMITAALGYERGRPLDEFEPVDLTVRIDRPGRPQRDFHTIGGGRPPAETPMTAAGGRRAPGSGTIITERVYLTDAAFTVAVTHPDPQWLHRAHHALRNPVWAAVMGRRSCPTDALLLPGGVVDDPVEWLDRFPLHRKAPRDADTVPVTFVGGTEPVGGHEVRSAELSDNPRVFNPNKSSHRSRTIWSQTKDLPVDLCSGYGNYYLSCVSTALSSEAST